MARILSKSADGWKPVNLASFTDEAELQSILAGDTTLIPGATGTAVAREIPLGGGAVDLLCIDELGRITLVGCKLQVNRESRRALIGPAKLFAFNTLSKALEDHWSDVPYTEAARDEQVDVPR